MSMEGKDLINANPVIYEVVQSKQTYTYNYEDEESREPITAEEIFELIRNLNDPEHPLTLEQLNVVSIDQVVVNDKDNKIDVLFTPTIPHCSMATLIGLSLRTKLLRSLHPSYKVSVKISPGTHQSEEAINKQLNDKERVAAALESAHLLEIVNKCVS